MPDASTRLGSLPTKLFRLALLVCLASVPPLLDDASRAHAQTSAGETSAAASTSAIASTSTITSPSTAASPSRLSFGSAQSPQSTSPSSSPAPAETVGTLLLDARLRYEFGDREDLEASNAFTLRTRLGYETPAWRGLSGLFEGQFNVTPDEDAYDPYPGAQGAVGKTVVSDGPDLRLNRAELRYRHELIDVTAGRQRIILDNARFVGDVGWRQNAQMLDAVLATVRPSKAIDLTYGYIGRAVRIFGSEADVPAQRRFEMRSNVIHGNWRPAAAVSVTGYAYLLGITNSPADASNTFGGFVTARHDVGGRLLSGRLELARQVDNGHSPTGQEFGLNYALIEGRVRLGIVTPVAGFESLGGNGTRGFGTPLATLHAFNGWADVFLTTPGDGLNDFYLSALVTLPYALNTTVTFHRMTAAHVDQTYGHELDIYVTRKINTLLTAGVKYATYHGASDAPSAVRPNLNRLILDLNLLWTHPLRRER